MNDLMRPALYGAEHEIIPEKKTNQFAKKHMNLLDQLCESTDKFMTSKKFQKLKEKDLVIICDVGAYGMSLSSNYNIRLKPPEILVKGYKINIIKKKTKVKRFNLTFEFNDKKFFIFNFFFFGIIFISIIFLPSFFLPQKIVLFGGKLMGYWSKICLKFFLSTKIVIKGKENKFVMKNFLLLVHINQCLKLFFTNNF